MGTQASTSHEKPETSEEARKPRQPILKAHTRKLVIRGMRYAFIIVGALVVLFPIYLMITTSLKPRVLAFAIPPHWTFIPTLGSYQIVLFQANFVRFFFNSLTVALGATLGSVLIAALASYGLVRFQIRGGGVFLALTLILKMIPEVILLVPVFLLWNSLGLINTRIGLILVYVALNLAFNIWIIRAFMMDIPRELEQSAEIDGCPELTIFSRIMLPLVAPGMSVAAIFTFRLAWNEFVLGLALTDRFTRTLPVAVSNYITDVGVQWGPITAIATIIAVPAFLFTFFAARSLISGLTAGAVKG